jgi:HD-GYP domain-containing protein (c-di-GMP phosphodiesterase class II)
VLKEREMTKALNRNLEKMAVILDGVINALSYTVEARDPYTAGHQKRVTAIAVAIAKELQLSPNQIRAIEMAGMIHDLGKIAIPAEILSKPGRISETEFNLLKIHPQVGYDILKDIRFSMPIAEIVFQHHERLNGQGYPRGLQGSEILQEARIIAVADVVEAMSSHRPYRPALGLDKALEEIQKNKGILYDPDVVDACCRIMEEERMLEL